MHRKPITTTVAGIVLGKKKIPDQHHEVTHRGCDISEGGDEGLGSIRDGQFLP